jgi:two-component system response regulator (stage 0 sporulation protein A)
MNIGIESDIEEVIGDILHTLGIPSHQKGFIYLTDIIKTIIKRDLKILNLSNKIYKLIADKYNTKVSNIERMIRYSIECGYLRANYDFSNNLYRNSINPKTNKQSNKEFIITVANKVRYIMS